jgi:hypothetical protein
MKNVLPRFTRQQHMLKKVFRMFLLAGFLSLPAATHAQGVALSANEKPDTKAPGATRQQRKAARKKWRADRKEKHQHEKNLKRHNKHLQTKETRKRMKETRHKAEMNNGHKREFFLKRWFRHRLKTTKKQNR